MYDIIIVGAGPAGLTAAIYARRASKKVLVLEAKSYGGQIVNTLKIENYPGMPNVSGFDFAENLYDQAVSLGTEILFEKVIEIRDGNLKEVVTKNNVYKGKTIILATGSENRKLGLDNEDKLLGKGVSYCATCDGNFYRNKVVAVIGSGKASLEDTLYLSDIVKEVYLINPKEKFNDEDDFLSLVLNKKNIKIIYNSNITRLLGNGKLTGIELTDKSGNKKKIDIDGLFVAIGRVPENENFRKTISLNKKGYIVATENCHTNVEGIFAAGDNRVKLLRQLVTATSDGAIAAVEAIKYINNK